MLQKKKIILWNCNRSNRNAYISKSYLIKSFSKYLEENTDALLVNEIANGMNEKIPTDFNRSEVVKSAYNGVR